jgi:RNA recognition motif-containing protein
MNLYVGNLSYDASEDDVRNLFEEFGSVVSVTIVRDRETQKARGFGFVQMEKDDSAQDAIRELNGSNFHNRPLKVNEARPREREQSSRGSYPRSGGSGNSSNRSSGYGGRRRNYDSNYEDNNYSF